MGRPKRLDNLNGILYFKKDILSHSLLEGGRGIPQSTDYACLRARHY
jgi:hypothetical protein